MEDGWISLGLVCAVVGSALYLLSRPSVRNLVSSFGFFLYAGIAVLLRAALKLVCVLLLLWLIGVLYPMVAHALGLPQRSVYELVAALVHTIKVIATHGETAAQHY